MSVALWESWGEEWSLQEAVSFEGDLKIIKVHDEITNLDIRADVYSAWVRWRARGNDPYFEAFRRTGLEPIPGGVTGDSYFLINGWKLYLDLRKVRVTGVLFSDDFETAYYDIDTGLPLYPAQVSSIVNVVTNTVPVVTGTAASPAEIWSHSTRTLTTSPLTASEVASAVRVELTPELNHVLELQNGLTSNQATMLLEIYKLYGLDPTAPLVVTSANRVAGPIVQHILSDETQTIITRA